jgi:RecJ-like exonuclease
MLPEQKLYNQQKEEMKVLTLHQCSLCHGSGLVDPSDINRALISESIPAASKEIFKCPRCQGRKTVEVWMDAREFIKMYMNEKIKPE